MDVLSLTAFMDDAVNAHLLKQDVGAAFPRFVAESSCRYFMPLAYPQPIDVGLRVVKLGNSSVAYSIGIFDGTRSEPDASPSSQPSAACGTFVHVYVDKTGRPTQLTDPVRAVLGQLVLPGPGLE
jgi:acyl-CoA thioester hydrolase